MVFLICIAFLWNYFQSIAFSLCMQFIHKKLLLIVSDFSVYVQTHAHWYFNASSCDQQILAKISVFTCLQKGTEIHCSWHVSESWFQAHRILHCSLLHRWQGESRVLDDSGLHMHQQLVTLQLVNWSVSLWVWWAILRFRLRRAHVLLQTCTLSHGKILKEKKPKWNG